MSVNAANVLTGAPDQATTGAILSGPLGTPLPTAIGEALHAALVGSGYVSEDGLTLNAERSTEAIRDWSGSVVRQLLTEAGATFGWAHLETTEESLRNWFGDGNVTVTAATAEQGKRIEARMKAEELPRKSWVFRMKDGKARAMIVVPDGQVTETGEVSFVRSGAITWPVTMTSYPDETGVNFYLYLDDGQVLVIGIPVLAAAAPQGEATGDLVTLTGSRLTGVTSVTVDGTEAEFTIVSESTLVFALPAGTAGDVEVVATNAVGPSAALTYTRA